MSLRCTGRCLDAFEGTFGILVGGGGGVFNAYLAATAFYGWRLMNANIVLEGMRLAAVSSRWKAVAGGVTLATAAWMGLDEGVRRCSYSMYECTKLYAAYSLLAWSTSDMEADAQQAAKEAMHRRLAPRTLALVLGLQGYYIKMAQTCVGANILPREYEEVLSVLLDDSPTKPFRTVRRIVQAELGCPLDAVYADFDQAPIGSASIGQVHRATLLDGTPVVCKVQYPTVERYFRLDLRTMKLLFAIGKWAYVCPAPFHTRACVAIGNMCAADSVCVCSASRSVALSFAPVPQLVRRRPHRRAR